MPDNENEKLLQKPVHAVKGGNNGGTKKHPESNMEIAVIARKRVRSAIQVLTNAMKAEDSSWTAKIGAAKALIAFAQLKTEDVRDLSDDEIRVLAKKIVDERAETKKDGAQLASAVTEKLQ